MSPEFDYDVFLSHSSKDMPVVRELAKRLMADGLRVWLDEWVIQPGDIIGLKIEQGLEHSRTLVLCMSENAFASEWVTLERHTILFRDPTNQQRRFIPLRLDNAPVNDTIKQFAYVDWRKKSSEQYAKLLAVCQPQTFSPQSQPLPGLLYESTPFSLGHTSSVLSVAVTGDGRRALSGSADKTVRVWDVESGKCLATLEGHTNWVNSVGVTRDGRIFSSANNGVLRYGEKSIRINQFL
jgi:WD40 repeat protein